MGSSFPEHRIKTKGSNSLVGKLVQLKLLTSHLPLFLHPMVQPVSLVPTAITPSPRHNSLSPEATSHGSVARRSEELHRFCYQKPTALIPSPSVWDFPLAVAHFTFHVGAYDDF